MGFQITILFCLTICIILYEIDRHKKNKRIEELLEIERKYWEAERERYKFKSDLNLNSQDIRIAK